MVMKKLHFFSFFLSLAIHYPMVYGFDFSFFNLPLKNKVENHETLVYYYADSVPEEPPLGRLMPLPQEGRQVLRPEEADRSVVAASSEATRERRSDRQPKPAALAVPDVSKREERKEKVLVPTVENIEFQTEGEKKIFFAYYDRIRERIQAHTLYPYQARQKNMEGLSYVSFVLKRSGKISNIVLLRTSGFPILDDAAISSIRNAEPFPPFPKNLIGEDVKLNVPISFEMDS